MKILFVKILFCVVGVATFSNCAGSKKKSVLPVASRKIPDAATTQDVTPLPTGTPQATDTPPATATEPTPTPTADTLATLSPTPTSSPTANPTAVPTVSNLTFEIQSLKNLTGKSFLASTSVTLIDITLQSATTATMCAKTGSACTDADTWVALASSLVVNAGVGEQTLYLSGRNAFGSSVTQSKSFVVPYWKKSNQPKNIPYTMGNNGVWTGTQFCKWDLSTVWNGGCYNPTTQTWTRISNTGGGQLPTFHSGAVMVWTGNRMCIWGGTSAATVGLPSDLSLYGGLAALGGGGAAPTPYFGGACYNPSNDSWTSISNTGGGSIPSREGFDVVVGVNNRMCLWGGTDADSSFVNDGTCYDALLDRWTEISNTGGGTVLSARKNSYFSTNGTLVCVWGGEDDDGILQSGSCYNQSLDSWASMANSPLGERSDSESRFVHVNGLFCFWGGSDGVNLARLNTGACYNQGANSWTSISNTGGGTIPAGRGRFVAAAVGAKMCIYGGGTGNNNNQTDGACYDTSNDSWAPMASTDGPPVDRLLSSRSRSHFGYSFGQTFCSIYTDYLTKGGLEACYNLDTSSWTDTSHAFANGYSGVINHSYFDNAELAVGSKICNWVDLYGRGTCYDTATQVRTEMTPGAHTPTARLNAAYGAIGNKYCVYGGSDVDQVNFFGSGACYNVDTNVWTAMPSSGSPGIRTGAFSYVVDNKFCVFGGSDENSNRVNSGACYSEANGWTPMDFSGGGTFLTSKIAPRWTGTHYCDWDGTSVTCYNPTSKSWVATLTPNTLPVASYRSAAISAGQYCMWGGFASNKTPLASGACYNPATTTWTAMTSTGAPAAHSGKGVSTSRYACFVSGHTNEDVVNTFAEGACYDAALDTWLSLALPFSNQISGPEENRPLRSESLATFANNQICVSKGYTPDGHSDSGECLFLP